MNSLIESIVYYLIKAVSFVIVLLPLGFALWIGRMIGTIGYYSGFKGKRIAYNNLRIAFCGTKTDQEIRQILKQCYEHFGQNIIELGRLPLTGKTGYQKIVRLEGKEHIEQAMGRGKGVIFLAIHSGNWELSSLVGSMIGYPYNLIAHVQKRTPLLAKLLMAYRVAAGAKIISTGAQTREIIHRLKANEIITLVVDQGGKDGQLVEFFGRQAAMSTGAIRLALKYGASICLVDISRQENGQHRLVVDEPLELIETGHEVDDLNANLAMIVKSFEDKISKHPQEYLWFYKIWKYSNTINILILDDGRTGHLRQSQALASLVADALRVKGKTVQQKIAVVQFRSTLTKRLCALTSFLGQWIPGLRSAGWLRLLLTKESFKQLTSIKADYLISCGAAVAGAHFLSVPWQTAKSMVILKPGLLPFERFDLVVLPQHDLPRRVHPKARVAVTRTALNLVDTQYLARQSQLLLSRYSHLKNSYRTKIGVMIGGDTKNIEFTESAIKIVIHQLKEVALQLNADILLTTSRRTPENIEQLIWREFKKFERCALLISATHSNVPEAIGGILGLCDYLVVSGESISMVSEAVASGKKTIVFVMGRTSTDGKGNKYEQFVDKLNEQGYLMACPVQGIGQTLYNAMRDKIRFKLLNDRDAIVKIIEQVV